MSSQLTAVRARLAVRAHLPALRLLSWPPMLADKGLD